MNKLSLFFIGTLLFLLFSNSCKKDVPIPGSTQDSLDVYQTTPYQLEVPEGFPEPIIPEDNLMTEEGVSLGKKLFYDNILSGDNSQSCGSCHAQSFAFSDNNLSFSIGIDGNAGGRNAMQIINAAWGESFFWDGRASSLENQALGPVPNPIEMHLSWKEAAEKLNAHSEYPQLFKNAFNIETIDSSYVAKAIAQFERTFISANSKFDEFKASGLEPNQFFTLEEFEGYIIFNTETGDCFHCHGTILTTDNLFHNNGLDENLIDLGLGAISGVSTDNGKFKTPSLRNIEFSPPYMHDGRFATLEEVVEYYSFGVMATSPNIDPLMKKANQGGIQLTTSERQSLVAFLKTFSDTSFLTNSDLAE